MAASIATGKFCMTVESMRERFKDYIESCDIPVKG